MSGRKQLTERDERLLSMLARCGALSVDQAGAVYGVASYHKARISELAKRDYIARADNLIQITARGAKAIGLDQVPFRVRHKWQRQHKADVAGILLSLQGWDAAFPHEVKRSNSYVYRGARFDAVVSKNGREYALYLLSSRPQQQAVRTIRKELAHLKSWRIRHAIVFYPSPEALEKFGVEPANLESLLLLPYPFGVGLLESLDIIDERVRKLFPGCQPCARPFADYELDGVFITSLVTNDLVKRRALRDYLDYVAAREARKNVIVCLASQKGAFAALFPNTEIVTVPDALVSEVQ